MAFDNPLDPIWVSIETARKCFGLAKRAIAAQRSSGSLAADIDPVLIDRSGEELEKLFVVALWAAFERNVIEYIQGAVVVSSTSHPADFISALKRDIVEDVEWWKMWNGGRSVISSNFCRHLLIRSWSDR